MGQIRSVNLRIDSVLSKINSRDPKLTPLYTQ